MLPAIIPLATSALARLGITSAGKGAVTGILSKVGGWLGKFFWGSKLAAAGTGALGMSMLSGRNSAAANSPAAAQVNNYRA